MGSVHRRSGWFLLYAGLWLAWAAPGWAAGVLSVEIVNGYNLVVDSNVTAPPTYAPKSAYIGGRVCNTGDAPLADVSAYVGNYNGGVGSTPGFFPVKTFGPDPVRPHLAGTGSYALTIEADATGAADGTRYIGTLGAGECRMQYWLFSYPQCVNVAGQPQSPPCDVSITGAIQPFDDLSLDYDVWATTSTGGVAPAARRRSFTMRNEISAAANKIWPNNTAKVPPEYLAAIQALLGWGTIGPDGQPITSSTAVYPGQRLITTQGIWYDLGNVGQGFDNDGDLIPDQNAWIQPVGDPGAFDADCFRMVNVYGIVIVKLKTGGELLIPFQNQLYFEHLPENTGVVGLVYYQYVATDGVCNADMTPYQEAASGYDNEKFSADYGLSLAIQSQSFGAALSFAKSDGVTSTASGNTLTYTLSVPTNNTGVHLGVPDLGVPLVINEAIPAGTTYVAGSAVAGLLPPAVTGPGFPDSYMQGYTDVQGNLDTCTIDYRVDSSSYRVFYSTDGGTTWSLNEPVPASAVTNVRWMLLTQVSEDGGHDGHDCLVPDGVADRTLQTSLPAGKTTGVTVQVLVGSAAGPVLCDTALLGVGGSRTGTEATDCDVVTGDNSLSGTVFRDDGSGGGIYGNGTQQGGETGIGGGVIVTLYYDRNGDGQLDAGDLAYASTTTSGAGTYSFSNLADGPYLVVVKKYDGPVSNGVNDAATDAAFATNGWGNTTFDPKLPLTTAQGILKLSDALLTTSLAVNIDLPRSNATPQSVTNVNFGFAPPFRLTKNVTNNPDFLPAPGGNQVADTPIDEGDLFSYTLLLENRLPSVGRQGPTGCQYTIWTTTGQTGSTTGSKDFSNPVNAYDATSPNLAVASAFVQGGGNRWLFGNDFSIAAQPGNITKVEGLYFGYFSLPLTDDQLKVVVGRFTTPPAVGPDGINGLPNTTNGLFSTAQIDSYIGAPPDTDPDSAISWDITAMRPGGGGWAWTDFPFVYLQVNPTKTANSDFKTFFLDAVGLRITTDEACVAGPSTTLDPVPLQDTYDTARTVYVSSNPPATSVNLGAGVIQWSNVGPILPGTSKVVTVTMRALNVSGTPPASCATAPGTITNTGCNYATTDFGGNHVRYADGRQANDGNSKVAIVIQGKAELRGVVWNDNAAPTGWPKGGAEPGLPNVTVTLFACVQSDGVTLETNSANKTCAAETNGNFWKRWATTLTDANGAYEFIGLDLGHYIVEVGDTDGAPGTGNAAPYGGTQTAEANDTQDVTGLNANGHTCPACNNTWGNPAANLNTMNQLVGEEIINGINFGYNSIQASLYGNVWHDVDGDTTRDPGDVGLPGFTVRLYTAVGGVPGVLVTSTTSDASGNYSFTGVAPGDYVIVVVPAVLRDQVWLETVESTGGTSSLNNQIPVTLASGQVSGSHDFGYTKRSTSIIGDTVYLDLDGNGIQNLAADGTPLEAGIPNVTVWLYQDVDRDGTVDAGVDNLIATQVTDANGKYLFQYLAAGSYVVKVDTSDPDFPSDTTPSGDPDVDTGRIGGTVWLDSNGDGAFQAGEDGLPNVVLGLYTDSNGNGVKDPADPLVAATFTGALGSYAFTSLGAGRYFVGVVSTTLPNPNLVLTGPDPAGALLVLATNGSSNLAVNAGFGQTGTSYVLGNRVWSDANGDGTQNGGEVGIPGVRVTVTGGSCATPCVTTTDGSGFWFVANLANGAYTATVDTATLPRNFLPSAPTGAPSNVRNVTIAGADLMSADFGYRYNTDGNLATRDVGDPTGSVSGRVYLDVNGNGAYDAGEGRVGATVNLLDELGNVLATTLTAGDGTYSFASAANTGVFIGQYTIRVLDPLGTRYSVLFVSASAAFPNLNVVYSNPVETVPDGTSAVTVDGVRADLLQDFGFRRFLGSIGDTVWLDVNQNAGQDPGEPGIAGVTVRLYACGWNDANNDNLFSSGEQTGCASPLRTTTTTADDPLTVEDEGGKYLFSNLPVLPADQYYLVEVVTATIPGGTPTLVADPDRDGYPCNLPATPGQVDPIVCDSLQMLTGGFTGNTNYLGADFGYSLAGSGTGFFGDHLWVDTDGDGALDPGELGIPRVTVWIDGNNNGLLDWTDGNGNGRWDPGEGERWTQTDSDGYYVFTGLSDGTYNVRVLTSDPDWPTGLPTAPTYEARLGNLGSRDNNVQVVISGGLVTSIVDGDPGTSDPCTGCALDVDWGYRYAGTNQLSGTICLDDGTLVGFCGATATTYSGVIPGAESPLSGLQVFLYRWVDDGDNLAWSGATFDSGDTFTPLGAAVTDANGDYSFANVPDDVVVLFAVPQAEALRLTTTLANTSVEDGGVITRQFYDGTALYTGQTVTVVARQALNLGGDADDNVLDLDFAFQSPVLQDFGDLPDPDVGTPDYNATLLVSGGARHRTGGIRLGNTNTSENDGYNSPTATGDTGDDGVTLVLNCGPDGGGIRADVQGTATSGWLAGWIDFNSDGDFADAGELVINQQVFPGAGDNNLITFDLPDAGPNCTVGTNYFLRFRIYPSQPLFVASTGIALDGSFQPTTGEVEDYLAPVTVTPAVVTSFGARELNGELAVEWETAAEVGTVGFVLERWDPAQEAFAPVHEGLLPSLVLQRQGGYYRYLDASALPGADQLYRLVEMYANGHRKTHGPWVVNSAQPAADDQAARRREVALPELDGSGYARVAHELRRRPASEAPPRAANLAGTAREAKLGVGHTGIHFVSTAALTALGGLPTGPANWAFSAGGAPVAFLPAADLSGAWFYGQQLDSLYARDNVYWVDGTARAGMRMAVRTESGPAPETGASFVRSLHLEQDLFPATGLFFDPESDYWIWDWVWSGGGPRSYSFRTDGLVPASGSAELTVRLKGGNETEAAIDHRVRVTVNGHKLADLEWAGTEALVSRLELPSDWLVDGDNVLELEDVPGQAVYSLALLDSFDVSYPSLYRAHGDRLEFAAAGHAALRVTGFSGPDVMVFDVSNPRAPVLVQAPVSPAGDGSYAVTVWPPSADSTYAALRPAAALAVTSVVPDAPSTLRQDGNRGEYLIVTTAALKASAQRLADHHGDLESQVVDIDDVYDEFGAGIPSPQALRDFLAWARSHWAAPPRYVLLAGDGSLDYKDVFGAGESLVPTMMVGTISGLFASDTRLADVDPASPGPELALGRLPARDAAELDAMIDKILDREGASGQAWLGHTLLLADNPDDGGNFPADSERMAGYALPGFPAQRIYLGTLGLAQARTQLLDGIDAGAGHLNYVGHAGYDVLADEGLLRDTDLGSLANLGKPTVVTALTCLAADFSVPGYPALGELLVRQPGTGAAAVWSATGHSRDPLAVALGEHYYAATRGGDTGGGRVRIGDATLAATRRFAAETNVAWMWSIYALLGDPAMWLD